MIDNLKPYPVYKDSGVPWLGKVPEHWEIRRLRDSITDCVNGIWGADPNGQNDLICVRVADFDRDRLRVSLRKKTLRAVPISARFRRLLHNGDLLLEKSGGGDQQPVGAVVVYDHDEPAVCSNFVARMSVAEDYAPYFVNYLHSTLYTQRVNVRSIKQTTGIQNLDGKAYLSEPVAFPPLPEQRAITRFLDHADRLIRRYIRAKQKLIKLLEEQKQAIIHQAVTRGLDLNVRLKPSGVEWLGDVPEGWEMVPNRALLKLKKKLVGSNSTDFVLLSLTKRGIIARDMENPEGKFPTSFDTYQVVEPGDLIFCLFDIDETPRAVGLSSLSGMVTGAYTRFACLDPDICEYVYRYYLAMDNGKRLKPLYTGLRKVITKSAFLSARMPLPPRDERLQIVTFIDEQNRQIDQVAARAHGEITLLREYRTRLIADVVTGKLDVRGWTPPAGSEEMEEDIVDGEEEPIEDAELDEDLEAVEA